MPRRGGRSWASRPTAFLIALLLPAFLAGCSGSAGFTVGGGDARTGVAAVNPATAADVLDAVRDGGGRVTLVNVWATWCAPCMEEMPDLLAVRSKYRERGMKLILISGDFDSERDHVLEFLAGAGVDFPTFIKKGPDMEFIDTLSRDWSGALPASFLYDSTGRQIDFWEGKITAEKLEDKIEEALVDG